MAHNVKCYYCGKTFDRDVNPFVEIKGTRRYAHKKCFEQNLPEKQKLEEYLLRLFKLQYLHPTIIKQIDEYTNEKGFTYLNIYRTLFYYYDIMRNKPPLANPNIGIVPYVYPQMKAYFDKLNNAVDLNKGKNIRDYRPVVVKKTIQAPERQPLRKRELFTFLDDEVKDD